MGRPPATKTLPYGSFDIINLDSNDEYLQKTAGPQSSGCSPSPQTTEAEEPAPSPHPSAASLARLPHSSLVDLLAFMDTLDDFPMALSAGQHKTAREILSDSDVFYDFHRKFMIGRSFSDSFRQAIMTVLESSDGAVLDGYTTVLATWDADSQRMKGLSELDLAQGSDCLKRLQAPAISHPEDAAAVVMLGQVLLVYHIVVLGTSAYTILRRSLLLVKDWYPSLLNQPALHAIVITPILIDTVESLVRREIPVVRAPQEQTASYSIVDRSAGLCLGLLYLQYELCRISHQAKLSGVITHDGSSISPPTQHVGIYRQDLEDIRAQVSNWEPRPSTSFFTEHTQFEVSAMMMQARVYRLATLLIIHRLQHPLGVEDEPAARLAMAIAAELECFVQWVPEDAKGLPIGFPLLVTMVELDHVSDKIIDYVSPQAAEPIYVDQLKSFVQLAKAARDGGFNGLWFGIAESKLTIPVLA
ncbi:hypothetical protein FDECE_674 [Fusarium decemcellulare]|nr:hypothetical protein FDECE_674 [Fusarium decemcellulare]